MFLRATHLVVNNGWTGAAPLITTTIAGPLAPGASMVVPLELVLQMSTAGSAAWDNYAEVTSAQDTNNVNRNDDADSVADNKPTNDNPVTPGDPDDNNILVVDRMQEKMKMIMTLLHQL